MEVQGLLSRLCMPHSVVTAAQECQGKSGSTEELVNRVKTQKEK